MFIKIKNNSLRACFAAFFVLASAAAIFPSCNLVQNIVHDGKVVAKVGRHRLYLPEVEAVIPDGKSGEDSLRLASEYINSWALDHIFQDVAEKEFSRKDRDMEKKVEEYMHSLLRFNYEQKYVNSRLDTLITESEAEAYYRDNLESFKLSVPLVKARFMVLSANSPDLKRIRRKLSSEKTASIIEADSLAYASAIRYEDFGSAYVSASLLAGKLGFADYEFLMSKLRDSYVENTLSDGNIAMAYVYEIIAKGSPAPFSYSKASIKEKILSLRKKELLLDLERDLMEEAKKTENFKVFDIKK